MAQKSKGPPLPEHLAQRHRALRDAQQMHRNVELLIADKEKDASDEHARR